MTRTKLKTQSYSCARERKERKRRERKHTTHTYEEYIQCTVHTHDKAYYKHQQHNKNLLFNTPHSSHTGHLRQEMVQFTRQRRRRRIGSIESLRFFIFLLLSCAVFLSYLYWHVFKHAFYYRPPLQSKITRGGGCGSYGCVIYPRELTESIRKEILDMKETKDGNIALSYGGKNKGGLTQQGKDHAVNQDRGIIVSPFYTIDERVQFSHSSENDFLIGIFDGHGDIGEEVAGYLQDNFHKRLSDKLSNADISKLSADVIKNLLNQTFVEMDQELPLVDGSEYNIGENGGSTASVIFRLGSHIFFANVGDSLSFLGNFDKVSGKTTIAHRNRYDKPHLPEEKERIESMKGKVFIPPHPINSRVMAFNPIRKETMSLGMSRSIGDNSHGRVGVIAEPIIDVLNLDEMLYLKSGERKENIELFVVTSSDGMYDHRQPQFVAAHFAECFFVNDGNPIVESANIIDLATPKDPKRYLDDMTVMALRIIV